MKQLGLLLVIFMAASMVSFTTSSCSLTFSYRRTRFVLDVNLNESLHTTSQDFLSLVLTPGHMVHHLQDFNYSYAKLHNLARALSPAVVRVGGSCGDNVVFVENSTISGTQHVQDTEPTREKRDLNKVTGYISGEQWEQITTFFNESGWDMYWNLNSRTRNETGHWDPSNARKLLDYSASRNIPIRFFQLGNDVHCIQGHTPDVSTLIEDYKGLKALIKEWPQYAASTIVGPAWVHSKDNNNALFYFLNFMGKHGCKELTDTDMAFYPEMTSEGRCPYAWNMTYLKTALCTADTMTSYYCTRHIPLSVTESLTPALRELPSSSRTFVAGLMWLNNLGVSATRKVKRVFKDSFFGGPSGLITKNLDPSPNYYLSVLYKRLVEGPVFGAKVTFQNLTYQNISVKLRAYAHCARPDFYYYVPGALVIYYVNVEDAEGALSVREFREKQGIREPVILDLFIFTSGDQLGTLFSRSVELNGEKLVTNGPNLPGMEPKRSELSIINLPPLSYGFIVIRNANVPRCRDHFHNINDEVIKWKYFFGQWKKLLFHLGYDF